MHGASYQSSAGQSQELEAGAHQYTRLQDLELDLERCCTCCGWCTGSLERRCTCTDQAVPFCLKCKVGIMISEAAAADAGRPPCTDDVCYMRSGCRQQGWGGRTLCQESARPAMCGCEYNCRAQSGLRRFMRRTFRGKPYCRQPPANDDDQGNLSDDVSPFEGEPTVAWDSTVDYAGQYIHLPWCRRSCGLSCNPTGRKPDFAPYRHTDFCSRGCGNKCADRDEAAWPMPGADVSLAQAG